MKQDTLEGKAKTKNGVDVYKRQVETYEQLEALFQEVCGFMA